MNNGILRTVLLAVPILATTAVAQSDGLEWSTFLGGDQNERTAWRRGGVLVAGDGDVLVWGHTQSSNFPMKYAYDSTYNGAGPFSQGDVFLTRIAADGSDLDWSTFLGGSLDEIALGLAVDPSGAITVCGVTASSDFPTTAGAFDTTHNGGDDVFVSRVVWTGSKLQLVWSTFLGGTRDDWAFQVAVHPTGAVVVAGSTRSTAFPIRGKPIQALHAGLVDVFVAVLSPDGRKLLASTFLGGSGSDWQQDLVLDAAGNPVVSGATDSSNFPTTPGAFQPTLKGGQDAFVSRVDLGLKRLVYSTLLGGRNDDGLSQAEVRPDGTIVLGGWTRSSDLPMRAGGHDTTFNGGLNDGYIAILDPYRTGQAQLRWTTFVGGPASDGINSLAVEPSGLITVAGTVNSYVGFPITGGAYQTVFQGGSLAWDAFVTRFDPGLTPPARQLVYSTYLGGKGNYEYAYSVTVDARGNAVAVGPTASTDFPTTAGSWDTTYNGGTTDVFVTKLTMLPKGVKRVGWSTPACLWPIYQGAGWPKAGNAAFALWVSGAAPGAPGAIVFGPSVITGGYPFLNVTGFVNTPLVVVPTMANTNGFVNLGLGIPAATTPGTKAAVQWLFNTTWRCPGTGPLSSSEALAITVR